MEMEPMAEASLTPSQRMIETLARTLRHEVGDLLQTVYSTVAILHERIPADQKLERRLLVDLKSRAENCKHELDAVVDLVCPLNLNPNPVDLAELVSGLVAPLGPRFPSIKIHLETRGSLPVKADPRRLAQIGSLLLLALCQAAQHNVWVRVTADPDRGEVEWSITDDSYGATPEQMSWLNTPFATTHHAQFGLGLALARRVVQQHDGRIEAGNLPEGGFRVSLVLPAVSSGL